MHTLPIVDRAGRVASVMSNSWLASDPAFDEIAIAVEMRQALADIHRLTLARPPADL